MPVLRLHLSAPDALGRYPVRIELEHQGRQFRAEALTGAVLTEDDSRDLHWYLERYLEETFAPHPLRAARIEGRMGELGGLLFRDLFDANDDTRALWAALAPVLGETRVEIAVRDGEAGALPWEWLWKPGASRPLAVAADSFVRVPEAVEKMEAAPVLGAGERLRILLVICRPGLEEDVPFRSVASRLLKAVTTAGWERIELTLLRPPTFDQLSATLRAAYKAGTPFHVVHFDGHGTYENLGSGARGYLMFEHPDEEDNQIAVAGKQIGWLLADYGVPVLVLNACRSGYAGSGPNQGQVFGSLAETVVATAGSVGVLAMRYNVYVVTAAQYVGAFYARLAAGASLGEAAAAARRDLFEHPARGIPGDSVDLQDWVVPVLHEPRPLRLLPPVAAETAPLFATDSTARGRSGDENDGLLASPEIGFIGRDNTLLALDRAFDHHRIVLLHAYAGSGKTTTAIEFARWYRDTKGIEGPIWFENFQNHHPLARVLDRIETNFADFLRQNNINWLTLDIAARTEITLQILAEVPVLWIWDNVEEVAGFPTGAPSKWTAEEQRELAEFLIRVKATRAHMLLTSRRDETGWLGKLPVRIRPGPMPMWERQQMTAALAEHHGYGTSVVPMLRPLLEWSQGNPMTITVVVGQALRDHSTTPGRITEYLEGLRTGEAAFDDDVSEGRSKSLGASLAYGLANAFSEEEQALLSLLYLFQGMLDVAVLVAMGHEQTLGRSAPYADVTHAAWTILLDRAAEIGLLTAHPDSYYSIHPALPWLLKRNFYCSFPATTEPPLPVAAWVHAIGSLASFWAHHLATTGDPGVLATLRYLEANLLHARTLALYHGWWQPALNAMQGLRYTHEAAGRWAAWADLVAGIVPLVEDQTTGEPLAGRESDWSVVAEYRVILAENQHDDCLALRLLEKALLVDRRLAASAMAADPKTLDQRQHHHIRTLGASLQQLGARQASADNPTCFSTLHEAKVLHQRFNMHHEAAVDAFNIGHAYLKGIGGHNLDAAETAYRESLDLRAKDDHIGRAKCHGQLGSVAWKRFDAARREKSTDADTMSQYLQTALDGYLNALALLPTDSHEILAVIHNQLGVIFAVAGSIGRTTDHLFQAIHHQEASGNFYSAALSRFNLACIYRTAKRFDDALDFAREAQNNFIRFEGRAADWVHKTQALIARIEQERTTAAT